MSGEDVFVIGVDGGTESIRVGLFDLDGKLKAACHGSYPTSFPQPGWAEQDPEQWWECLCTATKTLLHESRIPPERIKALALDATCCTVVFLDRHMRPLRNALLWMDVRANREAEFIAESAHPALKYNGHGNVSPEWMPCKALWIKRHEPDIFKSAKAICEYLDYMNYRLTGVYAGSINNASIRWYYDDTEEGFPAGFYETIGLEDLIPKFPQKIFDMGKPIGRLTRSAALDLGLKEGTLVAQGGADAFVGMVGLNVIKPGRVALITGSSHLHLGMSQHALHRKGIFGSYPNAVIRGIHTVEGGQISTGSIIQWFKRQFLRGYEKEAEGSNISLYDVMGQRAEKVPIGSEGIIVLDSFQGNRTPLVDPKLRGAIWGLSLSHRPEHIFRAIMEGVAYGTEFIFQTFREANYDVSEIFACGGATRSRLWMQIHSDVSGLPIQVPEVQDAPLLGSAILAAVASELYPSIDFAASRMVRFATRIDPNKDNHHAYRFFVDQYIATYGQVSELMHRMTDKMMSGVASSKTGKSG
jgi:FGGY-family pentulose kinase